MSTTPAKLADLMGTGFLVQRRMCGTCIYRPDSALDITELERQVRAKRGAGFEKHRACHHVSKGGVCCRGFWEAHKDEFPAGQIAQRLNAVVFVDVDDLGAVRRPKRKA